MCALYKDKVKYLNLGEYQSFSSRNNIIAQKYAKGDFYWFLNNDTELLNNNLHFMLEHFSDPKVGIVGNMHLFPNGSLNHIGIGIDADLNPQHIFPGEDPTLPYINHNREIDIVTAASVVIKKKTFQELGGFDENYIWGYEDVDLCLRSKQLGYTTICDSNAELIHFGQSTYGRTDNDNQNAKLFRKRWKGKLEPNIDLIYKERDSYFSARNKLNRKAKHITKSVIKNVIAALEYPKHNTSPAPPSKIYVYKSPVFTAFTDIAQQIGEEIDEKFEYIDNIQSLSKVPELEDGAMLISTTHFNPEYLERAPDWIREYRSYDINYERTEYSNPDYWTEHLKTAPFHILASSEYCADFLKKSGVAETKISIVPHGYNKELLNYDFTEKNSRVTFLVIINTNDEIRYGTDTLAKAIAILAANNPDILKKIKLLIKNYGGKDTQAYFKTKEYQVMLDAGLEIEYESRFLSKQELAKLYYKADAFIAPYRGEGFGMKILDAAAAGLPIICPDYGGPKDYLKKSEHIKVAHKLVPVGWGLDYSGLFLNDSYVWADVSAADLADKIEFTAREIDGLRESALEKRVNIRDEYHYQKIWQTIKTIDAKQIATQESNDFAFVNPAIEIDNTTTSHTRRNHSNPTTLLINTNRPGELQLLLSYLEDNFEINRELDEILIVNDGQKEQFDISKFDGIPIRYVAYPKWGGSGFARETGLRYSRNDHIIIIGDDIKPLPGFFNLHRKVFFEIEEPYLLMGHVEWDRDIRNLPIPNFATKVSSFQFGFEEIRNSREISYTHVYTSNLSFRKTDILSAKQHFKQGMILFEDTIWAKELAEKGFKLLYSRHASALHSHKTTSGWLNWLKNRSKLIGEYVVDIYTEFAELDKEINHTREMISMLSGIYHEKPLSLIKEVGKDFDIVDSALSNQYFDLEESEKSNGFNPIRRSKIDRVCGYISLLHRLYGITSVLTKGEDVSKGLALIAYERLTPSPQYNGQFGIRDSLRNAVFLGRQRAPIIFNPIYRIGKKIKNFI